MKYWILTDTHFGHAQLHNKCLRPDGFEEKILRQVRFKVKQEDVLIHLGDFCIGNDADWHQEFMSVCAGKRWLVKGNHDRKSHAWYLSHGWDCVTDRMLLKMFGKTILLSHRPVPADEAFDVNVHGHHHNTNHHPEDETTDRHRLVFIEHDYTPIDLRRIVEG